jgi:neutral ceramidase
MDTAAMRAGAARADITPDGPVHLSGAVGVHRPAQSVLEPLYARALVLDDGTRRACLVVLDVTIVTAEYSRPLREAAADLIGCTPAEVIVCATQTHSAPSLGHFMLDPDFPALPPDCEWLRGGDAAYADWALQRALQAVREAHADLEPVQLAAASGIEGRLAFNRRAVGRDGRVFMSGRTWPAPLGPTNLRYLEGPADPEVGVIALRAARGLKALLVHHTCHPVHVFPRQVVSPDWPGALCDELERAFPGVVPLVLNGACGNINPWPPFEPDYPDDHVLMGKQLADMAGKVVGTMQFAPHGVVDCRSAIVPLPFRPLSAEETAQAETMLSSRLVPEWQDETHVTGDWVVTASVASVLLQTRREGQLAYEVQALRLGDAAVVALPGEPFVEGQLALKIGSPLYPTYVAHCATQYVGYIPTAAALARGGHEVNTRYWAKLQPEALDQIVAGALELLQAL